jgi:hypothetical protein
MAILDSLFDVISASVSAMVGGLVGFLLNRKDRKRMANQVVVSSQALEKIKLENSELLKRIQDKENIILELQMQILGNNADGTPSKQKPKKKK